MVREKLNALHAARQNFCKAEASNKIKSALRHQIRTYAEQVYSQGDKVYYRRKESKDWKGPAKVLGKDGNFVLVREGKSICRCHPCQLIKVIDADGSLEKLEVQRMKTGMGDDGVVSGSDSDSDENVTEDLDEQNNAQAERVAEQNLDDVVDEIYQRPDVQLQDESSDAPLRNPSNRRMLQRLQPHNNPGNKESSYLAQSENPELQAKLEELDKLVKHDVYESVDDSGQQAISCKWVLTEKGDKLKARLVARGFEENFEDRKDSPTCSRESLRMVFAVAASMKWSIRSMDISSAFLQGNKLQRCVYIKPPKEGAEPGKLWKLKRCLYGLVDAPREWYQRVDEEMKRLGGKKSLFDKCLFVWHEEDQLIGMLIVHVDDFQFCGSEHFHQKVIDKLASVFKVSSHQTGNYRYIGLNVSQDQSMVVKIDQNEYCESLKEVPIESKRKLEPNKILNEDEKLQLKSISGKLLWATSQTRPEMAFETCQISNCGKHPTIRHLIDANKQVRKLNHVNSEIVFPAFGTPEEWTVVVYADGSHASLPSGGSHGGCIVFIEGKNGKSAPIAWRSKRIDRVTKSPLATEVSAVADGVDLGFFVASLAAEVSGRKVPYQIEMRTDSKSLKDHLQSDRVIRDPRLRVDTARLRQMTENKELSIEWVPGSHQLADSLTKKRAPTDQLKKCLSSGLLPQTRE